MTRLRLSETELWRHFAEFMGGDAESLKKFDGYVDDSVKDVGLGLPTPVFRELKALATSHSMTVHDFVRHLIDEALSESRDTDTTGPAR